MTGSGNGPSMLTQHPLCLNPSDPTAHLLNHAPKVKKKKQASLISDVELCEKIYLNHEKIQRQTL